MTKKRTRGSLIIFTDQSDFGFVAKWLGVATDRLRISLSSKKQNGSPATTAPNRAIFETQLDQSRELSDPIDSILCLLESRSDEFQAVKDKIINMVIFCKFSSPDGQGSAELSAGLIQRLAKQQVDLIIDLYPPESKWVQD